MEQTLVSILVCTYNSGAFVLETLQSIYDQTYTNIELVISDDASTDNTTQICDDWCAKNEARFTAVKKIWSTKNVGLSGNCNNALAVASGEWVKFIGGDDLLMPNCIASNIHHAESHNTYSLIASQIVSFNSYTGANLQVYPSESCKYIADNMQLKYLLVGKYIKAPGVMIKRQLLKDLNGLDTAYPMLEDDPFWIKANQAGYFFTINPTIQVKYRIHNESLSNGGNGYMNPSFFNSIYKFKHDVVLPLMKKHKMNKEYFYLRFDLYLKKRILKKGNNIFLTRNFIERVFLKLLH